MNKLIVLVFLVIFSSCKSDRNAEENAADLEDTIAFQKKIEFQNPDFALEPEARRFALTWVEYITAQNEIKKLENLTVNDIKNNAATIAKIMESLKSSVPDSLRSVAVEARLNVVNTKAQLLKQYSGRQEPDAENILQTTKELHLEFNNLKLQMNEIFLKTLEEFEKELDEFELEEMEQDSLKKRILSESKNT